MFYKVHWDSGKNIGGGIAGQERPLEFSLHKLWDFL